jgi:uncharacterized RDD family membrane protein YckC
MQRNAILEILVARQLALFSNIRRQSELGIYGLYFQRVDNMAIKYAGFWRRLGAALIDGVLLGSLVAGVYSALYFATYQNESSLPGPVVLFVCQTIIWCGRLTLLEEVLNLVVTLVFGSIPFFSGLYDSTFVHPQYEIALYQVMFTGPIIPTFANWLYHAAMESSAKQGTLGKMLLKIRVTDLNGQRLSFWRATARHFSKILSTFTLLIGFLMPAWTKKKQALHDKVSGCLVVRTASDAEKLGDLPARNPSSKS